MASTYPCILAAWLCLSFLGFPADAVQGVSKHLMRSAKLQAANAFSKGNRLGGALKENGHPLHVAMALQQKQIAKTSGLHYSINADGDTLLDTKPFREKFSPYGRMPSHISLGDVLLDYEVQFGRLIQTPDVLLDSLYSVAFPDRSCASQGPLFGNVSRWFTLGTDGGSRFRQMLQAQLEATSAVMLRPQEVLDSGFAPDMQAFVDSTNKAGAHIPGTGGRAIMLQRAPIRIQYTVGLHLSEVPVLMMRSAAQDIWLRTEAQCAGKPHLYKALVSLAAMTVRGVANSSETECKHAKRYLHPWLVRTHFGDVAKYVASRIGDNALRKLPRDVLAVSSVSPEATAFPAGVTDYLHLHEVAEVGRLAEKAPGTPQGTCSLAKQALMHQKSVKRALHKLGCGVYGFNGTGNGFNAMVPNKHVYLSAIASPREWLESMLLGRDLWTDKESLASIHSKPNLIFKSMGSWRMAPDSGAGYVFLECEAGPKRGGCLGLDTEVSANASTHVSAYMHQVASAVQNLPWYGPS